jgi:hypothetical protein
MFENRVLAKYLNLRRGSDKRLEKITVGNFTMNTVRGCGMKWSCLTLMYDLPV